MYFKPPRQDSLTQYSSERDKAWFGTQENVMWGQHRLTDPKRTSRDHLPNPFIFHWETNGETSSKPHNNIKLMLGLESQPPD